MIKKGKKNEPGVRIPGLFPSRAADLLSRG
jgi:hypothetical protein